MTNLIALALLFAVFALPLAVAADKRKAAAQHPQPRRDHWFRCRTCRGHVLRRGLTPAEHLEAITDPHPLCDPCKTLHAARQGEPA